MPSKVIIDVGARVASIEGADKAVELVQDAFDQLKLRPEINIDGKQLNAQLLSITETFKRARGDTLTKMMSTQTLYGDKIYKSVFDRTKFVTGIGGELLENWVHLGSTVTDASKELDGFYKKSQQLIMQIGKTGGKPTEMAYLNKELASTISKMEEFAKVSASVSPKGFMNEEKVAGMTKSLAEQYKVAMDNVNLVTEKNLETSIGKVKNAYRKMYEDVVPLQSAVKYWVKESGVTKKQLQNRQAQFRKSGNALVEVEKENWKILYENGAINQGKYLSLFAQAAQAKKQIKKELTEKAQQDDAYSQINSYTKLQNELTNKKIALFKAQKSMAEFGSKKAEGQEHINTLNTEIDLLNKQAKAQENIMIAGKRKAEMEDIQKKATARLNTAQAQFNAQGKGQVTVLQDIMHGFKQAAARVINYTFVYRSLWMVIGMGKQAIQIIKDLNAAMTDIQMVTGGTTGATMSLMKTYNQLAESLSATTGEVSKAAVEYLRQGKTVAETNELIKSSMVLSKVGAIESGQATEYLTSTMNGYEMATTDAMHVVDAMSQVDVKAATSVQELAIALQHSANSGRNAGVEFERLLGYIGAVSEKTRRSAETIGEAFKTMFARMQNIKVGKFVDDETSESLNDVEKALSKLGISLRTAAGDWRPVSAVLDDLNTKWDILSQTEKNAAAVAIGGVRQREILLALMDSYDRALVLENEALNSNGAAMKKYGAYQESIAAKQKELQAALEGIVYNDFTQSMYSLIMLDVPTAFVKMAKAAKIFEIALGVGVVTAISLIGDQIKKMQPLFKQGFISMQSGMSFNFDKVAKSLTFVKDITDKVAISDFAAANSARFYNQAQLEKYLLSMNVEKGLAATTAAQNGLIFAETTAVTVTGVLKGALVGLWGVMAANPLMTAFLAFTAIKAIFDESTTSAAELSQEIQDLETSVSELVAAYDELSSKTFRTKEEEAYLAVLERRLKVEKESLKTAKQKEYLSKFGSIEEGSGAPGAVRYNPKKLFGIFDNPTYVDSNIKKLKELYEVISTPPKNDEQLENWEESKKELVKLETKISDVVSQLLEYKNAGIELTDEENNLITNYQALIEANKETASSVYDAGYSYDNFNAILENARKVSSTFKESLTSLTDVFDEFVEGGSLSASTVLDLIANNSDLIDLIDIQNGKYVLNAAAIISKFEAEKASAVATLLAQQTALGSISALEQQRDAYLEAAEAAATAAQAISLKAMADNIASQITTTQAGWNAIQRQIEMINNMKFTDFISSTNGAKSATEKLNEQLEKQKELLEQLTNQYSAFKDAVLGVLEKEIDVLEKQKEDLEGSYEDQIDVLQERLDALTEEADEEDRLLAIEEARLEVQKAELALANAKNQRNARVYTADKGWEWVADPSAVQNAEEGLSEAAENLRKLLEAWNLDQAKQEIQDAIDALELARDDAVKVIDDQIESLQELSDAWADSMDIEDDLSGYKGLVEDLALFEAGSYETRLGMLENFRKNWQAEYTKINNSISATQGLIDKVGAGNYNNYIDTEAEKLEAARAENKIKWNSLVDKVKTAYAAKDYDSMGDYIGQLSSLLTNDPSYFQGGIAPGVSGWEKYKKFKSGGKVDYEGPAMVHGSKTNPEFMLNARELPVVKNLFSKMGVPYSESISKVMNNQNQSINYLVYGDINVEAKNQDTFTSVLESAMLYAKSRK